MTHAERVLVNAANQFMETNSLAAGALLPIADGKVVLVGNKDDLLGMLRGQLKGQSIFKEGLQNAILDWAKARKIIPNARAATQLMKTGSELGELFDAEIKGDEPGVIDGIGDVIVTLIIYAALKGLDINQCLAAAYDEIKDRTGTLLPSGVFVKD